MGTTRAITAFAVSGIVLSIGLAGCGSKPETSSESTSSSSSTSSTSAEAKSSPTAAPAKIPTISTYIADNGITETPVARGDATAPAVELPVPEGWATKELDGIYGAIVYTGADAGATPPTIVAYYSKLTGNVDPQKLLDVAPGELKALEGWEPLSDGSVTELSGFQAYQQGGTWMKDGQKQFVAQKTVIIPADGAVYVLQLNAEGLESQVDIIGPATIAIDDETTITPV